MTYLLAPQKPTNISNKIIPEEHPDGFGYLIGKSSCMEHVYSMIKKVAGTHASVFITGENGTGKELVARSIHKYSERSSGPFIAINCGAITTELIGSALFGHEKGSFTGANQAHQGYFEQASGGTLFLDELPEAAYEFQVKLLRLLETNRVIPVGGKRHIDVDVRIIVATNRSPGLAIKEGKLREDLYHRVNTFPIFLPPLRQRGNDILLLANYYLDYYNNETGKNHKFNNEAITALQTLQWPGNIRQLKNCIHRAVIISEGIIDVEHLCFNFDEFTDEHCPNDVVSIPINSTLSEAQHLFSNAVLRHYRHDKQLAAESLGINSKTLNHLLV
jgi:DNA-binding NtrC family response regulator